MKFFVYTIFSYIFIFHIHGESVKNNHVAEKLEAAHGLKKWWLTEVFRADIELRFGGQKMIDGTVYVETNGPRARLDLTSGERIVFDGNTCWVSPADSKFPQPRFHVLTWPWFISAPFKVRGDGTQLTAFNKVKWGNKDYWATIQTFDINSGDAPKDWYYLYIDPEDFLLKGMGYISTYGKTIDDANKAPYGIIYDEFIDVNGIKISTRWKLGHFPKNKGIDDTLGFGVLKNPEFIMKFESLFAKPANAREETAPKHE